MEKQKRWQLYIILAVIMLTLYNILPTVFFYSQPLKSPIDQARSEKVAGGIINRVNSMEKNSVDWLYSFSKLIGLKPQSIALKADDPGLIEVQFNSKQDADLFKSLLPRAGSLIPFVPAQLEVQYGSGELDPNKVLVSRQLGVHLNPSEKSELFHFAPKFDENRAITNTYKDVVFDRVEELAITIGGPGAYATMLQAAAESEGSQSDEAILILANSIVEVNKTLNSDSSITKRIYASFSQSNSPKRKEFIQTLTTRAGDLKTKINSAILQLQGEQKQLENQGKPADAKIDQEIGALKSHKATLTQASEILKKHLATFKSGNQPLQTDLIKKELEEGFAKIDPKELLQTVNLEGSNPFIKSLVIDWSDDKVNLEFYSDVQQIRESTTGKEEEAYTRDKLGQFVINEIARVSRQSDEKIAPEGEGFAASLSNLKNAQSFLAFDLGYIANKRSQQLYNLITTNWIPQHTDLVKENFPVNDWNTFKALPDEEKKLGITIYAPAMFKEKPPIGFHNGSVYVIARGLDTVLRKYRDIPDNEDKQKLNNDFSQLNTQLQQEGFIGYPGSSFGMDPAFKNDYIFELDDYYSNIVNATREDFSVHGSKRLAVLDFTDVEQRILTDNQIDDKIQEDLVKWQDDYNTAQVSLEPGAKFEVPPPTKNPVWENTKLSMVKYFRGDDRKVLKWGLDLSGGKTVRIGLRDASNRRVTDQDSLRQVVDELYKRINNLGVSERTIRIENENIVLEFPGSQGLSASDLIKASAMYFHIVNEKFSSANTALRDPVNQFLQNVWNEAVVTNRKDSNSINEIAWEHLGGNVHGKETRPRSEVAKLLYQNGLRLTSPGSEPVTAQFDETLSSVAMLRGDDFSEWDGQSHPLMFVFHNYALEGASLEDVRVGYDPTQGNTLSFSVRNSYQGSVDKGSGSPREDFYTWTSKFGKDQIGGTPKEAYSKGQGWRMAVILNDQVISSPTLNAALRDGGTITGRFTQREINQLAADLKAGSLSFTPFILSEENVSPDLGQEERSKGILASCIALVLVVIAMVSYYRFAGIVASCAVIFNLLIMWGVLQNLGAALTLPGIAGIVLTIGMAVDANVLVFERIREEFRSSGRIASAIQTGYRKAFSAIIDSNVTTIIAAIILIQFDSGPIKGFAITLIIGIVSSMFTALFMTRYFFAGWVQNPKNKQLSMAQFITNTNYDFVGKAKIAFGASILVIAVGTYLFFTQQNTIFGMDFTGGYSLTTELDESANNVNYRKDVTQALLARGAAPNDFEVRELSRSNQLRIQFGISMEEEGHPFYGKAQTLNEGPFNYDYERNPRIQWVVDALAESGLNIQQNELDNLDKNWTVMSGQFSKTMKNNAIIALSLALLSILAYITLRFEFKYALGAVIALAHDVIITLGVLAAFHKLGYPVQIDLQVIGAIMTIIGYSLNDTIIVFDRIREDLKLYRKLSFKEIINHALNVTLSRTIMTSGTTLLVLLTLVLLGGPSIFAFSLVMTIGVVVGTLSSLYIAGPVMLYFHDREINQGHATFKKA